MLMNDSDKTFVLVKLSKYIHDVVAAVFRVVTFLKEALCQNNFLGI